MRQCTVEMKIFCCEGTLLGVGVIEGLARTGRPVLIVMFVCALLILYCEVRTMTTPCTFPPK